MTSFTGTADNGSQIIYTDKKRHLYWMILIYPVVYLASIWLRFGSIFCLEIIRYLRYSPFSFFYIFTPLMDAVMGDDPHNPPEEVVNAMAADNYYRVITHMTSRKSKV